MTSDIKNTVLKYIPNRTIDHNLVDHHRRSLLIVGIVKIGLIKPLIFRNLLQFESETRPETIKYMGDNSYLINGWVINEIDLHPHKG